MKSFLAIFGVALVVAVASATPTTFYDYETDEAETFRNIYFLKSVSGNRINSSDYPEYFLRMDSIGDINHLVSEISTIKTPSNSTCDAAKWLHCGADVLECVQPCHEGVDDCVECLGNAYKDCCGCIKEHIPEIPCSSV